MKHSFHFNGFNFDLKKDKGYYYIERRCQTRVNKYNTKTIKAARRHCLEILIHQDKESIKNTTRWWFQMNLLTKDYVMKRFEYYFKLSLRMFYHPLFGFDLIKFDNKIQTPDGISTDEFITNKYGIKARNLIKGLI